MFVSRHLMSEMAMTAEHLIVIGRGELIADTSVAQFIRRASANTVRVRSPQAARLRDLIAGPNVSVSSEEAGVLTISGLEPDRIGITAAEHGIALFELTPQQASLEEAFMELTQRRRRVPGTDSGRRRDGRRGKDSVMSAATLSRAGSGPAERRTVGGAARHFLRVLRSEWIKVRSLRSTKITLAVAVVLMAGIGLMSAVITAASGRGCRPPAEPPSTPSVRCCKATGSPSSRSACSASCWSAANTAPG